jgi:UPF0042 nucleotide-binding protein
VTDPEARPAPERTELVIVTGMSGAGRTTTANVLEDSGWYVVDNLPPHLLVPLTELAGKRQGADGVPRIAAVVDVRARGFTHLRESLDELRSRGWRPNLVFLDATDEALVRRFESVRRPHPLQGEGRLLDGIVRERSLLQDLRADADVVIDTSGLNVHQLAKKVAPVFTKEAGPRLRIAVMSFGFKYGVPLDADFVFDMRFLPNPFWIPELSGHTGLEQQVKDYVLKQEGATEFIDAYATALAPVLAGYRRENKRHATIALGCTGGKHRSVVIAEELGRRLGDLPGLNVSVKHRDLGRE